jgi:CHAT domain-containing protein/tetratricopeptide (TPR) repeat protein
LNRSLIIRQRSLGSDHPDVAAVLNSLAMLDQSRSLDKAQTLIERSLGIREKALGPDHPDVGSSLHYLAELYRDKGRFGEAEVLFKRSLSIREIALGADHSEVGASLNGLAILYQQQGRLAEAEPLYKRSLAIWDKAQGPDHPNVEMSLYNLAALYLDQNDWTQAAVYWRRNTSVTKRRADRGLASTTEESSQHEVRQSAVSLVQVIHRVAVHSSDSAVALFETAQSAHSSQAAASLAKMAARSAMGSLRLAPLVRERQDLVGEWQMKDKLLVAAKSEWPAKRRPEAEKAFADRLVAIDARIAEIDQKFKRDFPDYAALSRSAPLSIAEVQAELGADEALVLFLDTDGFRTLPGESFVWIVTKSDLRWVRSDVGTSALAHEVAALRCGLDAAAWHGDGAKRCTELLGPPVVRETPGGLRFDHLRAHKLYMDLFSNVVDLIKDKHLLIVPSGPLTQLPFHALVTQPPTTSDHRAIAWLAREHAVTVLPAVSSLKALRRVGRPSAARRALIGFGNPLLAGLDARDAGRAKLARAKGRCPDARDLVADRAERRGGIISMETRGGLANVSYIKVQAPLPETADELCTVAQYLKADPRDIRLGALATEREIKRISASGELAQYRMIHFATHGALAGELDGTHEPGLILTPPATATEEDDGYLAASEIASLKLDADWVILSACNTAAGAAHSAEALSGLGRAFIYAGARALLVSHWAVYSDATVKLITGAIDEIARDAKVGRAEAMRRSMLALIDKGTAEQAHPTYWAPFVVVGEGAARK